MMQLSQNNFKFQQKNCRNVKKISDLEETQAIQTQEHSTVTTELNTKIRQLEVTKQVENAKIELVKRKIESLMKSIAQLQQSSHRSIYAIEVLQKELPNIAQEKTTLEESISKIQKTIDEKQLT
jgi:chromosome segregation ATPase